MHVLCIPFSLFILNISLVMLLLKFRLNSSERVMSFSKLKQNDRLPFTANHVHY